MTAEYADPSEAPSSDLLGRVIANKYRIVRLLGEGGMGRVYEAQHVVVGRRFALKFLHPALAGRHDAFLRFRREAQAAGALESEHIAAVTDFDIAEDGSPYIVMEYLVGESLGELLAREGPLPVPRVIGAMLQVCRGLDAAHAAGIVHRDLKPDNLFVVRRADGAEQIKILDFGIAKLDAEPGGSITHTGARLGTPFYMAPEQARGEKQLDHRVDVHALGVILYELLSGEKPHPGDSYNAILAHIISQPPRSLGALREGLPPGLVRLVHRALATDPRHRPASVLELSRELATYGGREVARVHSQFELASASPASSAPATSATAVTAGTQSGSVLGAEQPRRARSRQALLSAALVAVLLVSFGWWWSSRAPDRMNATNPPLPSRQAAASIPEAGHASAPASDASALAPPPSAIASGAGAPGHSAGRPAGRPSIPIRSSSGAAAASSRAARPVTSAADSAQNTGAGRRVTFDVDNPYE